jgi:maltoporin
VGIPKRSTSRRSLQLLALSGFLATSFLSADAFAEDPLDTDADPQKNTEAPKEADGPPAVLTAAPVAPAPVPAPPPRPKFGDVATSGYFRGGFGASNQKGRMTCFQLALPGGMFSKYRLGNECEVWGEFHLTSVVYADDEGVVATMHFMPTVFIPTTYIGYTPTGVVNSPLQFTTSTGATLSFPNLYADIKGIPWLLGGTAWAGTRYYKRELIYISDFFYWNPSGVGAGIEDINLGKDLRLSYGAFAVDGEPMSDPAVPMSPPLANRIDFGVRNDLQLRGIKFWESGEFQLGFQYIVNYSNNPAAHGGWGATLQYVQKLLGGENKLAVQYGRGGGTGFGTLARFYYPDFSVRHPTSEWRFRILDVLTIQPVRWFGAQVAGVFQRDDLGTPGTRQDWYSGGARMSFAFTKHAKFLVEQGFDVVKKYNGADPQFLSKSTIAAAITAERGFWARPELRIFLTGAVWNESARGATVDSGRLYTATPYLNGYIFGLQGETWW